MVRRILLVSLGLCYAARAGAQDLQLVSKQQKDLSIDQQTPLNMHSSGLSENYREAARFSSDQLDKMLFDTRVTPHWLPDGRFWYSYTRRNGSVYYLVDPLRKTKTRLFDPAAMAAMLSRITGDAYEAQHLPSINPRFSADASIFRFDVSAKGSVKKIVHLEYVLQTAQLREYQEMVAPKRGFRPGWLNISPDSAYAVYAKGHNLYYMDRVNYSQLITTSNMKGLTEHALTQDGIEDYGYERPPELGVIEIKMLNMDELRQPADVVWSPDSRRFAILRKDRRQIKPLWVINALANPRPTLLSYKFPMPGEADTSKAELWVFTIASGKKEAIAVQQYHNQLLTLPRIPREADANGFQPDIWLSGKANELYFSRQSRDLKQYDFCSANLLTGEIRVLISEKMNSYVEANDPIMVKGGKEMIWLSERDGWAHFYRYDTNGRLKNQITSGGWHCQYEGYRVDARRGILYFNANGREMGEDPYYRHFYRVNFDGTGLQLLNPGNEDHSVSLSPDGHYFIDQASRVNTAPKAILRDINGKQVCALETADLSALFAAGYRFPQPFKVKADDGQTDIYGVMYKPFNFDSTKSYPIIEYVYPGPQTEAVNKAFSTSMDNTDRLAQLGFIVISLGNRGGSPNRSKWYHDYGYNNMRDYALADKKYAIEQLAQRYSYIDINRVGIFGHSGGGMLSAAALCQYPDFYKVAISASGNHDNTIYNAQFTEKYNGITEVPAKNGQATFRFDVATNPQLAARLKGHLLLVTGDMDNNVHPAHTLRMANALIQANKRFDLFVLPGQTHYYRNTEYVFWLYADYFVKHLLNKGKANQSVTIGEWQDK